MGNLCTGSNTVNPTRADLPHEPPLGISSSLIMSEEVLETKTSALINLQQSAFETNKTGKHLAGVVLNERKKAANLMASVAEKIKRFHSSDKDDSMLDLAENVSVKSRRSEIQECITALENIAKTALARTEESLYAFVKRLEHIEKQTEEILDYVSQYVVMPNLPKSIVVKTNEMERSGTKIVALLEEARKQLSDIDDHRAQTSKSLGEIPRLLEELIELLKSEPDSESAEIVIEDIEAFDSGPVEPEVATEVEVMESESVDTRHEVEVAAEAVEAQNRFCAIYDESKETAYMLESNVLKKLYAQHQNGLLKVFDQDAVFQIFGQLLVTKYAFDSLQETQPLSFDVFTVSYFHTEFQEAPMYALVQFLEGLKEMVAQQDPIGLFISSVIGMFTAKPYPQIIANQIAQMGQVLDRAIDTWEKVRWADISREAFESQPRERLRTGGRLHLLDVLNLFDPILNEFPQYGGKFVESLRPPLVRQADFLHFLLVHRMRAMNRDGISLYKQISEDGMLTSDGLEAGLRLCLNLHLSQQAVDDLFFAMRNLGDSTVRRLDFLRFLKLQTYLENERSDRFIVSKFQVLQAFADVCIQRRRDLISQLHTSLKETQPEGDTVKPETAESVLKALGETRDLKAVLDNVGSGFEEFVWRLEQFGVKTCPKPYFSKNHTVPEPERALQLSSLPAEVAQAVTVTS